MPRQKGTPKTGGRQKGAPNKLTANLKDAILGAFDEVGGQAYLQTVATTDPRTFCTLLGKVLPTTIAGDPQQPIGLTIISGVPRDGDD